MVLFGAPHAVTGIPAFRRVKTPFKIPAREQPLIAVIAAFQTDVGGKNSVAHGVNESLCH